ncbi:DinB family protein [Marmoricola endophyticus]|uniref:DinB family protein n=1 Tax=Marmoricola endophyticus TaxID=2040280 RepID=UPI001E648E17|nr:DinB family protein [Marmoricola endophyticus]
MTRTDVPDAGDERSTLLRMLDYTRRTAIWKVEGLADADAQRAPLPTSPLTSPGGLLSHLRWVEHSWVERRFAGRPDRGPWTRADPDADLRLGLHTPLAEIVAGYREQIEVDDAIVAGAHLDDLAVVPARGRHQNLRWTLLHLIEETARHNGHLDLLREMADGSVGN